MTYPPQQPGPYGPPDPYGQQPPWVMGQQVGYPIGPPPPKSRSGLIAALIIVGILVLGGGGVGIYLLSKVNDSGTGGPGDDGPDATAARFAGLVEEAANNGLDGFDVSRFQPVTCGRDYSRLREDAELERSGGPTKQPEPVKIHIGVQDLRVDGDRGSFTLTWTDETGARKEDKPLTLERDGGWKVCGLYPERTPPQRSTPTSSRPRIKLTAIKPPS